ncbi:5-methylcytosine-specific restriction enzyme B [Fimbriiglobus ruber]|uniref:5-methylcytosine-specific restriction enzyme B n=1 Tax=Fimbriiglobus ruber TaxID=1908690 RepID=A0A225DFB7_9BACT|nr:5-methylcytosine-specific restriction enzyme B [Fimbriiglobus ruber]
MPGVGPAFWSAIAKATAPDKVPDWTPAVQEGLARLNLLADDGTSSGRLSSFASALSVYESRPDFSATDLDTFFARASGMRGRELGSVPDAQEPSKAIARALREVRSRVPLRKRATEFAQQHADYRAAFDAGRAAGDGAAMARVVWQLSGGTGDAPTVLVSQVSGEAWFNDLNCVLGTTDLSELVGGHAGLADSAAWYTAGVLHLLDPTRFPVWNDAAKRGLHLLDDAADPALAPLDQYWLYCVVAQGLREEYRVHPGELQAVLAALVDAARVEPAVTPAGQPASRFDGFCTDTFRFLAELSGHNQTGWMAAQRDRYRFVVREPLVELCTALAGRYVRPVLGGEYGWDLETDPRPGRTLASILKHGSGQPGPYSPVLRATFYPREPGRKRDDVQFFIRVDATGVSFGWELSRSARDAGRRFRKNVQELGEQLYAAVRATGAIDACTFATDPAATTTAPIRSAGDLREWASAKDLIAVRHLPADSPTLRADDLVGEILILFDRLVPFFAAAVEDDPLPILARRAGTLGARPTFGRSAFQAATYLSEVWLTRTLDLLRLKKQLVLQGVPGTGKTHVARSLARFLTGDRPENQRLVQFHPGYSYEEFVEGIRPRVIETNGRSEVSYPVEPGLLATFAARAEAHPSEPHVLVIDEINRGNLPRVFGELLFLLEYRDQEILLPYSKRPFRLPNNLYFVATMNPADRSAAGLDVALRRRFSFVEMAPDAALLARWLDAHSPADADPTFAPRAVRWFEEMNRKLARDAGPDRLVGHSYFMVPDLTADRLQVVWDHHVRPVLEDAFPGRPDRIRGFDPGRLASPRPIANSLGKIDEVG